MKKVLFLLSILSLSVAASAQFMMGGTVGYTLSKGDTTFTIVNDSTRSYHIPAVRHSVLTILPKFGYQINDNMQAGIALGAVIEKTTRYDEFLLDYQWTEDFEGYRERTTVSWMAVPYFRYQLPVTEHVSVFAEVQAILSGHAKERVYLYHPDITGNVHIPIAHASAAHDSTWYEPTRVWSWGVNIVPGLSAQLGDHCSLDLYVDLFKLAYRGTRTRTFVDHAPGSATPNTEETVVMQNDFDFGINAAARDMNTQFNWFRLGFNLVF